MKNYFLLLLLSILLITKSNAQNWNTTPTAVKNYFTANSILKYIAIDSIKANNSSDSVYHFYATYRDSSLITNNAKCIDANAAAWMGKLKYRNENTGIELFFNYKEDTITIHTAAPLGSSWTLCADTGLHTTVATVTAVDTLTIDGVIDSIKEISVQHYINSAIAGAYYNTYKIVLSKNNGWLSIVDLYSFSAAPKFINNLPLYGVVNSSALFNRISKNNVNVLQANVDLDAKFTTGNEWQYYIEFKDSGNNFLYIQDSIITAIPLGNYKYNCTINKKVKGYQIVHQNSTNMNVMYLINKDTTFTVITDSFYTCFTFVPNMMLNFMSTEQAYTNIIHPENKDSNAVATVLELDTIENNTLQVKSSYIYQSFYYNGTCFEIVIPISSGVVVTEQNYNAKLGITDMEFGYAGAPGFIPPYKYYLKYAKIITDIYGAKINFNTLDIPTFKKINFSIAPNPAYNTLYVQLDKNTSNATIHLLSIDGKLLHTVTATETNAIDITYLPKGLYFLKINAGANTGFAKFVKE